MHQLMSLTDLVERQSLRKAGVNFAIDDELIDGRRLFVIGQVASLKSLLTHPVITKVHGRGVSGGPGAYNDHAAGGGDEDRSRKRRLTRMLENDYSPFGR